MRTKLIEHGISIALITLLMAVVTYYIGVATIESFKVLKDIFLQYQQIVAP